MNTRAVKISVGGMTCASCSRRVERALSKLDGVSAIVNYATGEAHVEITSNIPDATLLQAIEQTGYTAAINSEAQERFTLTHYRHRLAVAVSLTVPIVAISMVPHFHFAHWQWLLLFLTLPVVTWVAWPLHLAAATNAKHKAVTMDTLVSLGIIISYGWSLFITVVHSEQMNEEMNFSWNMLLKPDLQGTYFEVAASVTTLVMLGKFLELRARAASTASLESLAALNPKSAIVIRDGQHHEVAIALVKVGDIVFVPAGKQIPIDAVVIEGSGHVDMSMVTGESRPISIVKGDQVIGASTLLDGSLTVQVTAVGNDTVLAGISRLVHQAQSQKATITRTVDQVSSFFVPVVMSLALVTGLLWI